MYTQYIYSGIYSFRVFTKEGNVKIDKVNKADLVNHERMLFITLHFNKKLKCIASLTSLYICSDQPWHQYIHSYKDSHLAISDPAGMCCLCTRRLRLKDKYQNAISYFSLPFHLMVQCSCQNFNYLTIIYLQQPLFSL